MSRSGYNRKKKVSMMGRNTFKNVIISLIIAALFVSSSWAFELTPVKADVQAGTMVIVTTDYTTETVNVQPGPGVSNKFYMSTDNQKTWEVIPQGILDISSLLSPKKVTIYFKGNKDTYPFPLEISEMNSALKAVYGVVNGVGSITLTPATGIQYRNGANGNWSPATSGMLTAMYEVRGASLSFRIAPTAAVRAGKIVTVRIPKRPTAPSVRLDPGKLSISGIKAGKIKYLNKDGFWTDFLVGTPSTISITKLLSNTDLTNTVAITGGTLEFYTPGTGKKLDSAVRVIEIPNQITLEDSKATLVGTTLSIVDSDQSKQYEYTVVDQGKSLDYQKASWSSITSKKSVIVSRASIGSNILVRLKSTTDRTSGKVSLPSTYITRIVSSITQKK